jgi:hypothetical protein
LEAYHRKIIQKYFRHPRIKTRGQEVAETTTVVAPAAADDDEDLSMFEWVSKIGRDSFAS